VLYHSFMHKKSSDSKSCNVAKSLAPRIKNHGHPYDKRGKSTPMVQRDERYSNQLKSIEQTKPVLDISKNLMSPSKKTPDMEGYSSQEEMASPDQDTTLLI
jgi:hypothetical protein